MKKLKLNLEGAKVLSKAEQRSINGGSGWTPGSCAFDSGNGYSGMSGVSLDAAEHGASVTGGNYCCDSCCDVGWLDAEHKEYLGC